MMSLSGAHLPLDIKVTGMTDFELEVYYDWLDNPVDEQFIADMYELSFEQVTAIINKGIALEV